MSHLTTHVLDASAGIPAVGMRVVLRHSDGSEVARGNTDSDGRAALGPENLAPGDYELRFNTGEYFASGGRVAFYPFVSVAFTVDSQPHYHVPLLLSPFAYSTYRGS